MKHDGGSAFPRPLSIASNGDQLWDQEGMSLRDYFAAHAILWSAGFEGWNNKDIAKSAYEVADSMLEEREKLYTKEDR